MALVAVGTVVLGLQVCRRDVSVRERITFVVVIRVIVRKLVVPLELEPARILLDHAYAQPRNSDFAGLSSVPRPVAQGEPKTWSFLLINRCR
ncbi:MAG: hypothetical protein DMG57_17815 [Acidobacteria bacterium]|nr:MAG: hypothetical protein DMG57_17815 [Acidobacteriota bacterium]